MMALRRKLKASVLFAFLNFILTSRSEEDKHEMEINPVSSVAQAPMKHLLLEIEIYCYLLVLIFCIDKKRYNEAKVCASASITWLKNVNRRTIDVLAMRLYFYYSLCYELTVNLAEIRGNPLPYTVTVLQHCALMS